MNKLTPPPHTSQVKKIEKTSISKDFLLEKLNNIELQVLTEVIAIKRKFKCVYASLGYLALRVKRERSYVGKIVRYLESLNLLEIEERQSKTHVYHPNKILFSPSIYSFLIILITNVHIFNLALIRSDQQCPQLILNDNNLLKQQTAAPTITAELSCWQVMELNLKYNGSRFSNGGSWQYQEKEKVTASKTNEYLKGDVSMFNFTEQQLEQIAAYSQEAVARAGKRLKQVTSEGRAPQDPFSWFLAICRSYVPTEEKPSSPFTPGFKKEQQPQKQSQPPKEWSNQDDIIRQRLLERKQRIIAKAKECGVYDPRYTLDELRMQINGYKVLPLSENVETTARTEMSQPEPVTKSHDIDWNSLVPPLIFDENFDSQYQEILD